MTAKQTADKALNMLHELKDLCYSEQSNEIFDDLHDNIYWQCVGLSESMSECETEDDWDSLLHEWLDALQMAKDIKNYYRIITNAPDIGWIYS